MPHLTIEYTANVALPDDTDSMLLDLHNTLESVGGISLANCKSRLYRAQQFLIADGRSDEGFVHLEIIFVRGRSDAVKSQISRDCLEILKTRFLPVNEKELQITVHVGDMAREMYSKHPEGTL